MRLRLLGNRMAALLAAYAVALQALLSAFAPVAPGAALPSLLVPSLTSLCASDGTRAGHGPGDGPACASMCATLASGLAGSLPLAAATAVALPRVALCNVPADEPLLPGRERWAPQAPRGPPRA